MQKEKLKLEGICKSFHEKQVLDHLSVYVKEGEHVTLLGPSGCGKSTVMNILTGILQADHGSVTVNGTMGYMQQKDLLLPWKTCLNNVILPLVLDGMPKKAAAQKVLPYFKTFHLEGFECHYPEEMSGGMRQRAALLRTFLSSGDILLLDEPFGAVDSITRESLQEWLIGISSELKLTILMITHDIDEAILLSDRIYVLSDKPTTVCDEICLDTGTTQKTARLTDPSFLQYRRRIIEDLKQIRRKRA